MTIGLTVALIAAAVALCIGAVGFALCWHLLKDL